MNLAELVNGLEQLAPPSLASDWDNTGLLIQPHGSPDLTRVLLTVDLSEAVLSEAIELSVQAIVAYHPPIFAGLKRIVTADPTGALVVRLLQHQIAVYTPHTALDAIPGGMNDWLCEAFGGGDKEPITPIDCEPGLLKQLADSGARGVPGLGRLLRLPHPLKLEEAIYQTKQHLGLDFLRVAACPAHENGSEIKTVAVCAGAGSSVLSGVQADLLLTGEMRHHDVLSATRAGSSVLLTEHSNSERGYLPRFAQRLNQLFPALDVRVSAFDRDPLKMI